MSVLAVVFFGLCVTSVWAECGICDKETQCIQEPAESDCEFGVVTDTCNCCLQCAKGIGQPCGTGRTVAAGICAPGLICKLVSPRQPSRCDEDPRADDKPVAVQEVPADVVRGDNIQDIQTLGDRELTEVTTSILTPSRNRGQATPSVTQLNNGRHEGNRNNQQERPFRHHLPQPPIHNTRTPESQSADEIESPIQERPKTEEEAPSEEPEEREVPAVNVQGHQAPNAQNQGILQRVRGNGAQNGRTRGDVPLLRERSTSTTTTETSLQDENEPLPQEGQEQEQAENVQEEKGEFHTTQPDATEARQDPEIPVPAKITPDETQLVAEEEAIHDNPGEETAHTHAGEEATPSLTGEEVTPSLTGDESTHRQPGKEVTHGNPDKEATNNHAGEEITHSQAGEDITHSHAGEEATHSNGGEETSQSQNADNNAQSHIADDTIHSQTVREMNHRHKAEGNTHSNKDEEGTHIQTSEDATQSHTGDEHQHAQSQDDAIHAETEVEAPEPTAPAGQNRHPVQVVQNNNNEQNRSQRGRALIRRTRNHKEPTLRHEHEGSIQNLNAEDKDENTKNDSPNFDNRTNK
ncbi:hypothetical protein SK128_019154 [Halocaridina rubra]|uniref:IGFBP N-terminal domain-containing protein n=1 Tax=Halocaridina rubra TaxID=373956 RepID=A0AAN8XC91_HALRR